MNSQHATLYYFHDPMCSWCWAFSLVFEKLLEYLPASIMVKRILGGLAPDTNEPMTTEMQEYIKTTWRKIEASVPGIKFNFSFWEQCRPRRATYAACRAVIAARLQGEQYDVAMTRAIQQAYYKHARNPSDHATLEALAAELGLDEKFARDLCSQQVEQQLQSEIGFCREMFVESFPSLVLQVGQACYPISINYLDYRPMLELIIDQLQEAK